MADGIVMRFVVVAGDEHMFACAFEDDGIRPENRIGFRRLRQQLFQSRGICQRGSAHEESRGIRPA